MERLFFTIDFIPTKRRPRFAKGRTYTDAKTTAEMRGVAKAYKAAYGSKKLSGPVAVSIYVHGKLPKSAPKSVSARPNTHRPDADNVAKCCLDALNGVAWDDDAQVTRLTVRKFDDTRIEQQYTSITIEGRADG